MRFHILKTLLQKELHRHLANRGGLVLALLLIVAALLLSIFGKNKPTATGGLTGELQVCFLDYEEENPWIGHLRNHVPSGIEHVLFRRLDQAPQKEGKVVYPPGAGAIQVRKLNAETLGSHYKVWIWHPDAGGTSLAPYEAWFWRETQRFFAGQASTALARVSSAFHRAAFLPQIEEERSQLAGGMDPRSALATSLVLFALFFVCVYLLPSLTCEERERGILLAQALSPASPGEILLAKFLFYPVMGMALAATLAGIYSPAVLTRPVFWLALLASAMASLGVGLTIASLARTQRAASMGSMCYMMAVALLVFICQQNNIPVLPYLAVEFHCPRMLHAALADQWAWYHWGNVAAVALLAMFWGGLASVIFQRRGWQ
ncbi:MAG: ABC transporter permease [Gemmataceae bacterium]